MAVHYVCDECGGVSDHAGVCQTGGCYSYGKPLRECHCTDNKHGLPEEIKIDDIEDILKKKEE